MGRGKPAARVGDPGSHGGTIISGAGTVLVNGKPMARVGDIYACPVHGPNPIVTGVSTVFGPDLLVAHVGSKTACGAVLTSGSPDTFVDDISATDYSLIPDVVSDAGNRYFIVVDENDTPIPDAEYVIIGQSGQEYPGVTDENGRTSIIYGKIGEEIRIKIISTPDEFDEYQRIID